YAKQNPIKYIAQKIQNRFSNSNFVARKEGSVVAAVSVAKLIERGQSKNPRVPRCRARARLGPAARCHGADRPFHRRRRHRPLPGYGASRSRDSTIWFTRLERAIGTDPPRATKVQLKRKWGG